MTELLSRVEVAKSLGVSPQTVQRLINRGELNCIKVGKRMTRISTEELDRFLLSKNSK